MIPSFCTGKHMAKSLFKLAIRTKYPNIGVPLSLYRGLSNLPTIPTEITKQNKIEPVKIPTEIPKQKQIEPAKMEVNSFKETYINKQSIIDYNRARLVYNEFMELTQLTENKYFIDVTALVNKYKISNEELLCVLVNHTNEAKFSPDYQMDVNKAKELLKTTKYIENYKGIVIKTYFRDSELLPQYLNIVEYDKAHGEGGLAYALSNLLDSCMEFRHEDSIRYDATKYLIRHICININPQKPLYHEFVNHTTHMSGDTVINITELMDKWKIEGYELFHKMYHSIRPFMMGWYGFDANEKLTLDKAKEVLESRNYGIDYYNGKPFKNNFRKNHNESQIIRIKKFDDRSKKGQFYECIVSILDSKMTK